MRCDDEVVGKEQVDLLLLHTSRLIDLTHGLGGNANLQMGLAALQCGGADAQRLNGFALVVSDLLYHAGGADDDGGAPSHFSSVPPKRRKSPILGLQGKRI